MKILHLLSSPRAEGTVKIALDWLSEPGHTQEVFVLRPKPEELKSSLEERAAWYGQAEGFPAGKSKFGWMTWQAFKVCCERQPDLVICWPNGFCAWLLIGAWLAGVPSLITHAGNPPTWDLWGRTQTVFSTFAVWLTGGRMICCSAYVATQFARSPGVFSSVLRVVYNCAPIEPIRSAAAAARARRADGSRRLIMVATLELHKDHSTLLRAMPEVVAAIPDVQLWLVGEGTQRGRLEALSTALNLGRNVSFLGSRRDVPELLGQSDAFVFSTTKEEGLGTVLIEALAAGLPIVASDVPACREALADGRWGTLIAAHDPAALAEALIRCLRGLDGIVRTDRADYLRQFLPSRMIDGYLAALS
jgi:glycosyltransferase involved in cell wall biosynthesis